MRFLYLVDRINEFLNIKVSVMDIINILRTELEYEVDIYKEHMLLMN